MRLPMTRAEADNIPDKGYSFRVLQDVSIRRTWKDDNRTVSMDFTPTNDKAVLITVDYRKPVTAAVIKRDAAALAGGKIRKWTQSKGKAKKRLEELGMKKTRYARTEGGGFLVIERAPKGKKYSRIAYFASEPRDNRWELNDFDDSRRVTALGSTAGGDGAVYLRQDEERRRKTPAKPVKRPTPVAVDTTTPDVDDGLDDELEEEEPTAVAASAAAAEEEEKADSAEGLLDKLTPLHYGIAGGVLVLLLLIRAIVKKRAARRRAELAASIINRGKAPAGKKPEDESGEQD